MKVLFDVGILVPIVFQGAVFLIKPKPTKNNGRREKGQKEREDEIEVRNIDEMRGKEEETEGEKWEGIKGRAVEKKRGRGEGREKVEEQEGKKARRRKTVGRKKE